MFTALKRRRRRYYTKGGALPFRAIEKRINWVTSLFPRYVCISAIKQIEKSAGKIKSAATMSSEQTIHLSA